MDDSNVVDLKKDIVGNSYSKAVTLKDVWNTFTSTIKKSAKPVLYGSLIAAGWFTITALRKRSRELAENKQIEKDEEFDEAVDLALEGQRWNSIT